MNIFNCLKLLVAVADNPTLQFTPGHCTDSFVFHFNFTESIHFGALNFAISVLPGTHLHLSQVKHVRVKYLTQGHNIETMSRYWEGGKWYFSENPAPSGVRNRKAGSDNHIGKAPRPNHCTTSLLVVWGIVEQGSCRWLVTHVYSGQIDRKIYLYFVEFLLSSKIMIFSAVCPKHDLWQADSANTRKFVALTSIMRVINVDFSCWIWVRLWRSLSSSFLCHWGPWFNGTLSPTKSWVECVVLVCELWNEWIFFQYVDDINT